MFYICSLFCISIFCILRFFYCFSFYAVSFLFLYKSTDDWHRVGIQMHYTNIISYIASYHTIPYHITSYRIYLIILYVISYNTILYRIIYHIVSYHNFITFTLFHIKQAVQMKIVRGARTRPGRYNGLGVTPRSLCTGGPSTSVSMGCSRHWRCPRPRLLRPE